jgi:hypothetical protein
MTLKIPDHLADRVGFRANDIHGMTGVSRSQVRRLILEGQLVALKLDGIVLVTRESLERWLASAVEVKAK